MKKHFVSRCNANKTLRSRVQSRDGAGAILVTQKGFCAWEMTDKRATVEKSWK